VAVLLVDFQNMRVLIWSDIGEIRAGSLVCAQSDRSVAPAAVDHSADDQHDPRPMPSLAFANPGCLRLGSAHSGECNPANPR
jgi:hypothetical protein